MSKLLFFDIDGTLAMPGRTVSRRTRDAIRAARANGHKAFICTGRSPELVNEDILSIGFDGGIFHAGGRAVIDGKTVYENHADAKMLHQLLSSNHVVVVMKLSQCQEAVKEFLRRNPQTVCHYFENVDTPEAYHTTLHEEIISRHIPYFSLCVIYPA